MAKYLIQEYNKEMTVLINQYDVEQNNEPAAVVEAYNLAQNADVVVLWRRSILDKTRLTKIAKFY